MQQLIVGKRYKLKSIEEQKKIKKAWYTFPRYPKAGEVVTIELIRSDFEGPIIGVLECPNRLFHPDFFILEEETPESIILEVLCAI